MTILDKKKTSKEKSQQEQSNHDHHANPMIQSGETSSSRGGAASGRSRTMRHSTINPNSVVGAIGTEFVAENLEGSNQNEFSMERSLAGKRRGRTSPHAATPYAKMTRSPDIASSSGNAFHRNSKNLERPKSSLLQSSTSRIQRQRRRPHTKVSTENSSEAQYNSEDEYEDNRMSNCQEAIEEKEKVFEAELKHKLGYIIKKMDEDGACLFRAVADQVYGDQGMADEVRRTCMDYMHKNRDYFREFVTEDFTAYVERKRLNNTHGNHLEMQAMAEIYNRTIEVYEYTVQPINTLNEQARGPTNPPIRVSYHRHSHYNSVVDPHAPTIGIGLGLPSFHPGLAEKTLMEKACKSSENEMIEQQMLADKLMAADRDYTEEAILQQIRERSLAEYINQTPNDNNNQAKEEQEDEEEFGQSTSSTLPAPPISNQQGSCSFDDEKNKTSSSLPSSSQQQVEIHNKPSSSATEHTTSQMEEATTSQQQQVSTGGGVTGGDWVDERDEMKILEQILMKSQQEYYEQLKQAHMQDERKSSSSGSTSTQQKQDEQNVAGSSASCSSYPTSKQ